MTTLKQSNLYKSLKEIEQDKPQGWSDSETDVSTSNENLSSEEKYLICHMSRQEPQGQENLQVSNRSSLRENHPSNRSSLDVSSSSYNTLIIHSAGEDPWIGRNSGSRDINSTTNYTLHQSPNLYSESKLLPLHKHESTSTSFGTNNQDIFIRHNPEYSTISNAYNDSSNVHEITEIPDDYLNQSSVLKHLAKEVNKVPISLSFTDGFKESMEKNKFDHCIRNVNNSPTLPTYNWSNKSPLQAAVNSRSCKTNKGKLKLSKSQPDLSKIGLNSSSYLTGFRRGVSVPRPPTKGRAECEIKNEKFWPSTEMIEILIQENSALKQELDNFYRRVEKTQKLEDEILKVHKAHEDLVESCERRDRLERAARIRLQMDCRRYQEINRALREQVDLLQTQMLSQSPIPDSNGPDILRRELSKRENLIKQLISQSKELAAAKERQEIELTAQRATLQEQRTHIGILDTALTNAQGNVVRLEDELRKKQVYVDRVAQLQRTLTTIQHASNRREQTERKLRLQLERELQQTKNCQGDLNKNRWDSSNELEVESLSELKRQLREKEEKLMLLEGQCSKWEQRYMEESTLRQAAIDAASIPKDAKIAALEKTSQETERIIAEARSEKIRHMDEVHAAQKKVADLESRLKDLESKLAEKDAMIRVLQKHTFENDVSSMLGRSPHHTPHQSLSGEDIGHVLGTTVSREDLVSSVLTNSTTFGSTNSYVGSDSSYHIPSYNTYESNKSTFKTTKHPFDNQLKDIDCQLDSQLLSKRGLCCFPGFNNPVTVQRKEKIPKPILTGVNSSTNGIFEKSSFLLPPSRHETSDMLLLEKQGRTSQQQRMQEMVNSNIPVPDGLNRIHCPAPSSLPRPPRSSSRSGLPRRMGDYNRLPDTNIPRKKSDGTDSLSSNASSIRTSPARALIPPSRKLGEYGRLSESGGSSSSLRKSASRLRNSGTGTQRDSASTLSDNSASSLPSTGKNLLYSSPTLRRGSSLSCERKSSNTGNNKFRIQF